MTLRFNQRADVVAAFINENGKGDWTGTVLAELAVHALELEIPWPPGRQQMSYEGTLLFIAYQKLDSISGEVSGVRTYEAGLALGLLRAAMKTRSQRISAKGKPDYRPFYQVAIDEEERGGKPAEVYERSLATAEFLGYATPQKAAYYKWRSRNNI